jgi:hypothetical protein
MFLPFRISYLFYFIFKMYFLGDCIVNTSACWSCLLAHLMLAKYSWYCTICSHLQLEQIAQIPLGLLASTHLSNLQQGSSYLAVFCYSPQTLKSTKKCQLWSTIHPKPVHTLHFLGIAVLTKNTC